MRYRITSRSGADHGTYSGATPAEALLAMHRDAGYGPDRVQLTHDDGREAMRYHGVGTLVALGTIADWHIEPIEEVP